MLAQTPSPPYYAVIFTSVLSDNTEGYHEMAMRMEELALQQPGCLGVESAASGLGVTVSYWKTEKDILDWKNHPEHKIAQELGRTKWYAAFQTRVAKVERDNKSH